MVISRNDFCLSIIFKSSGCCSTEVVEKINVFKLPRQKKKTVCRQGGLLINMTASGVIYMSDNAVNSLAY